MVSSSKGNALKRLRRKIRSIYERVNKTELVEFGLRSLVLPSKVRCLQKARQPTAKDGNDVTLLSVVRNGVPWLEHFLEHHRRLGVRQFVIVDNGSEDNTVAMLRNEPDVTLLHTTVPYHAYENTMKRYLARQFAAGRWCLLVDVDELFDWPLRGGRKIEDLIGYLEQRGYNAVICQLLDMWAPEGLAPARGPQPPQVASTHYTFAGLSKEPYPFWETNEGVRLGLNMHWGGLRKVLFGTNNGLTKVSLFKVTPKIEPFWGWHHVRHAKIADLTCVLYHYPFTEGFGEKVKEAVATRRYGYTTTDEYEAYHRTLQVNPISFDVPGARALTSTDSLLESGFLVASDEYAASCRLPA